jgi:hypothetical protein
MTHPILEVVDLDKLRPLDLPAPIRLVFLSPKRGGPALSAIREALSKKGQLRFSATATRTFVDVTSEEPEAPLIALDTIVRDDAAGLERMLFSVIPHVDEIVLGVDGRSDKETLKVAQQYADCVYVFEAIDIGMRPEDWAPTAANPRGKIDFAAARNIGRSRVQAPWALVLDSDEYLIAEDFRDAVKNARPSQGAFFINVVMADTGVRQFVSRDHQRLARTGYVWSGAKDNQLDCKGSESPAALPVEILHDTRLRADQDQRDAQREAATEDLVARAERGDLNALFHLAKHRIGGSTAIEEAVRLTEDFRLRVEPNSPIAFQRQWVALGLAFRFYNEDNHHEANRWACRVLLDGPSIAAFCLLGDVAECEGDLERACNWYEAACAVIDTRGITWPGFSELRWGRLVALRFVLAEGKKLALNAAGPDSPHGASTSTGPTAETSG